MHELGIAQEVLKIVQSSAQEHGGGRVSVLRLSVGEMSGVEPEALRFALEAISQGTSAEGMRVEIQRTPVQYCCGNCSAAWPFDDTRTECSTCGAAGATLRGGDDLRVDSFDLE